MITVERHVDADAEQLWAVVADPASWPEWTASMTSVQLLDGRLEVGARARVVQPGLPPSLWTVTELVPGESFVWATTSGGVTTVGSHLVRKRDGGRSRIELGLDMRGLLAPVLNLLMGKRFRRYVTMEADGLKAAAEFARR
ncbi:SRPBCC family protein [Pseudonocardia endophytica]|uniref:Polyketide cyclase/dehydrase/lipid transport protein n=1 Tax=Pseudonocardia endophytica TaxID=401976 RepID=A0A4R1I1F7_PSEEN|nr:SRPBCC family protein [Pseudonocardia endophytica]TCK27385.1 polyketide cyclase/dehydrase/lipid transport protein [Pseudonocardia endophytica]